MKRRHTIEYLEDGVYFRFNAVVGFKVDKNFKVVQLHKAYYHHYDVDEQEAIGIVDIIIRRYTTGCIVEAMDKLNFDVNTIRT